MTIESTEPTEPTEPTFEALAKRYSLVVKNVSPEAVEKLVYEFFNLINKAQEKLMNMLPKPNADNTNAFVGVLGADTFQDYLTENNAVFESFARVAIITLLDKLDIAKEDAGGDLSAGIISIPASDLEEIVIMAEEVALKQLEASPAMLDRLLQLAKAGLA